MNLTAARPLLATRTEWTGLSPPRALILDSTEAARSAERLGTPRRGVLWGWKRRRGRSG